MKRPKLSYAKELGKVLIRERERADLSQERLAHAAGIDQTYLSQLERGLKSPSLDVITALSNALGLRPHTLIKAAEDFRQGA